MKVNKTDPNKFLIIAAVAKAMETVKFSSPPLLAGSVRLLSHWHMPEFVKKGFSPEFVESLKEKEKMKQALDAYLKKGVEIAE